MMGTSANFVHWPSFSRLRHQIASKSTVKSMSLKEQKPPRAAKEVRPQSAQVAVGLDSWVLSRMTEYDTRPRKAHEQTDQQHLSEKKRLNPSGMNEPGLSQQHGTGVQVPRVPPPSDGLGGAT